MDKLEKHIYKYYLDFKKKGLKNYNVFIDNLVFKPEFKKVDVQDIKNIVESNYEMYNYFLQKG